MRIAAKRAPAWRVQIALHLFTLSAIGLWWVYAHFVSPLVLPGPQVVVRRMLDFVTDPSLARELAASLGHVFAAVGLSFCIGAAAAFAAHAFRPLRLLINGRLTPFLNAFSGIGWLFMAILWFGLNSITVVFAVTMVLIPFTIINLGTGLQELDADLVELGRSLSRNSRQHLVKVVAPMLLPYVFAALRTSFGVAWKVVLTAELFGGNTGAGYLLNAARQEFNTETIFAIILFILLFVAFAEMTFFRPLQRRLDHKYGRA